MRSEYDDDEDGLDNGVSRFGAEGEEIECWTPGLVGKALVWALRIARKTAGSTHPRQYGSGMPEVFYTAEEIREMCPDEGGRKLPPSSNDVARADSALFWQTRYLGDQPELLDASSVLKVWLRTKTHRGSFDKACDALGWARRTAYRRRDRALSVISQGLARDRVPVWRV